MKKDDNNLLISVIGSLFLMFSLLISIRELLLIGKYLKNTSFINKLISLKILIPIILFILIGNLLINNEKTLIKFKQVLSTIVMCILILFSMIILFK
jgi:hypothetical protein